MASGKRNKLASTVSWTNKDTEVVHNNQARQINATESLKNQLSSSVLPMAEYSQTAGKADKLFFDREHETNHRATQDERMKNAGLKNTLVSNSDWNDSKNERMNLFDEAGKKTKNILDLFNSNEHFKDTSSRRESDAFSGYEGDGKTTPLKTKHRNSSSMNFFPKKNTLNVSGLRKQEMMASQLALNNHYETFINQKVDSHLNGGFGGKESETDGENPMQLTFNDERCSTFSTSEPEFISSHDLTHKQKKQRFLEGQDGRMMFSDTYSKRQTLAERTEGGEVSVHTLELNSVPENLTADDLKRALKIGHLISVEVETDNLK